MTDFGARKAAARMADADELLNAMNTQGIASVVRSEMAELHEAARELAEDIKGRAGQTLPRETAQELEDKAHILADRAAAIGTAAINHEHTQGPTRGGPPARQEAAKYEESPDKPGPSANERNAALRKQVDPHARESQR